jgi:hypothetical protein
MFNVILSNGKNEKVVFRNMEYNTAFTISVHMNTITVNAAKRMGKIIKTVFSVVKDS